MRRSQRQIIRLLLELAKAGIKKTPLMHAARLNHSQLQRYIQLLFQMNLLWPQGSYYVTTRRGLRWLDVYATLRHIEEPRRT